GISRTIRLENCDRNRSHWGGPGISLGPTFPRSVSRDNTRTVGVERRTDPSPLRLRAIYCLERHASFFQIAAILSYGKPVMTLQTLRVFHSDLLKTELGKYLSTPYSYLAMLRPSEYFGRHSERDPVGSKYLFVYPFTKKREWYSLPFDERRRIMKDHVQAGQKYPSVTIHTSYSFG